MLWLLPVFAVKLAKDKQLFPLVYQSEYKTDGTRFGGVIQEQFAIWPIPA